MDYQRFESMEIGSTISYSLDLSHEPVESGRVPSFDNPHGVPSVGHDREWPKRRRSRCLKLTVSPAHIDISFCLLPDLAFRPARPWRPGMASSRHQISASTQRSLEAADLEARPLCPGFHIAGRQRHRLCYLLLQTLLQTSSDHLDVGGPSHGEKPRVGAAEDGLAHVVHAGASRPRPSAGEPCSRQSGCHVGLVLPEVRL